MSASQWVAYKVATQWHVVSYEMRELGCLVWQLKATFVSALVESNICVFFLCCNLGAHLKATLHQVLSLYVGALLSLLSLHISATCSLTCGDGQGSSLDGLQMIFMLELKAFCENKRCTDTTLEFCSLLCTCLYGDECYAVDQLLAKASGDGRQWAD